MMQSALNKLADFKACDFIKKRSQSRCFLVNIAKFLRTPMLVAHRDICLLSTLFVPLTYRVTQYSGFHAQELLCVTKYFLSHKSFPENFFVGSC